MILNTSRLLYTFTLPLYSPIFGTKHLLCRRFLQHYYRACHHERPRELIRSQVVEISCIGCWINFVVVFHKCPLKFYKFLFNLLNTCLLLGKIMRTDFILQFTDSRIILVNLLQFIAILVAQKIIFVNFWLNFL